MKRKSPARDTWAAHLRSLGHDRRMTVIQDALNSRVRQVVQMGELRREAGKGKRQATN